MMQIGYGYEKILSGVDFDDVLVKVADELKKEGFGVLTTIDVKDTLKKKLDVDFKRYVILGACNPPLAHQALSAERDIGLLLPCNVIVYAADNPAHSVVAAIDPIKQLELSGNTGIEPIARDVRARLEQVLRRIAA